MRMIVMLILFYVGFKVVQGLMQKKQEVPSAAPGPAKEETFQDPVCGVYVTEDDAVIGRLEGERLHFCSMACLEKYRESLAHKS